ncbi:MAG: hypothetical protein AABZ64_03540 [Nitrospinota bacterium]
MRIISSRQQTEIEDPFRSKLAMVVPVLEATLHSLARDRIVRLGGIDGITLHDLAREFRTGHGDAGICFEYAVHEALANQNELIAPLASEVLSKFCKIKDGAQSILFGPEKDGVIPILESVQDALSDDSVVLVGNAGRPPKLRRYIPQIVNAYRRNEARNSLPRSINGIWKADLFIGNSGPDQWVATTVKINPTHLQGAQGLRIGIYPKMNEKDRPRRDDQLNLVRLPLPYDGAFMELFYKAFNLVRAFLKADGEVPSPVYLPDAEDRFLCRELSQRKKFPVTQVLPALRDISQENLLVTGTVTDVDVNAVLSEETGLTRALEDLETTDSVTLVPETETG